jgi:hypothetical protein
MKAVILAKAYDKATNTPGEIDCREIEIPKNVHDDLRLCRIIKIDGLLHQNRRI